MDGAGVYDAIFIGGGAAVRFGSAYLQAMGGRALVIDRWPFLGGTCPHQACVPHHLFSEAAGLLDRERRVGPRLWFRPDVKGSILELVDVFRAGRVGAHAFMNWQTRTQLEVEYVLNAAGRARDPHTVEAAGRVFRTRTVVLALGARQQPLDTATCDGGWSK
jgi:pyruvate/2-oxoglutarate dehydrogenase complex dihydrolipoamide dehydrogenase (E3) component